MFRERSIAAVKPVLRWRGLCSSPTKGNGEVQKERNCMFNKVMLIQQNEKPRLTVTRFGMQRNRGFREGRTEAVGADCNSPFRDRTDLRCPIGHNLFTFLLMIFGTRIGTGIFKEMGVMIQHEFQ